MTAMHWFPRYDVVRFGNLIHPSIYCRRISSVIKIHHLNALDSNGKCQTNVTSCDFWPMLSFTSALKLTRLPHGSLTTHNQNFQTDRACTKTHFTPFWQVCVDLLHYMMYIIWWKSSYSTKFKCTVSKYLTICVCVSEDIYFASN